MSKEVGKKTISFQKNLQSNVDHSFIWSVVRDAPSKRLKCFNALI